MPLVTEHAIGAIQNMQQTASMPLEAYRSDLVHPLAGQEIDLGRSEDQVSLANQARKVHAGRIHERLNCTEYTERGSIDNPEIPLINQLNRA